MRPLTALLLLAAAAAWPREYKGIKRPSRDSVHRVQSAPAPLPQGGAAKAARPADTVFLTRTVRHLPVETPGEFLGMMEGVRCFNCRPHVVEVGLSDSLTRHAGYLALRLEAWNAIQRPLKDRRVYDHHNACFFFGAKEVDTVMVAGEPAEVRRKDKPCYPYLQRVRFTASDSTSGPVPIPAPAPAAPVSPPGPAAPAPTAPAPAAPASSSDSVAPGP